jgi:hypothetical protein
MVAPEQAKLIRIALNPTPEDTIIILIGESEGMSRVIQGNGGYAENITELLPKSPGKTVVIFMCTHDLPTVARELQGRKRLNFEQVNEVLEKVKARKTTGSTQ